MTIKKKYKFHEWNYSQTSFKEAKCKAILCKLILKINEKFNVLYIVGLQMLNN